MKNFKTLLLLLLMAAMAYGQAPTRIYDLPASGTLNDNIYFPGDMSGWNTYRGVQLLTLKNYINTGYSPSGDITLDFARINGNSLNGAVNYNYTPTTGYFLRAANSSGLMEWVNLETYMPWASIAEISAMSNVNSSVRPYHLPIVRINGAAANTSGQTIDHGGLRLIRYWNGHQIEWRLAQDFISLPELLEANTDQYMLYFAVDHDDSSEKLGFLSLVNLINAEQFEMILTPPVFHIHYSLAGTTTTEGTNTVSVEIYWDGTEISTYNTAHFSTENLNNVTSVAKTVPPEQGKINISFTIPATLIASDGSEFAGADIIYTNPTTGVQVRERYSIMNPYITGGGGIGIETESTLSSVHFVDDWPTTETEGLYLKLGSAGRIYYIDNGLCQWGYEELDGTNGVCLESK